MGRFSHRIRDRKVHHILDGLREVMRIGVDALENLLMTPTQTLAQLVPEDVQVAEQGLHRRAQFMGQVGQRLEMYFMLPSDGLLAAVRSRPRRGKSMHRR